MPKFYITTAIDYANGAPHIGHALEKIQADAIARYERLKGSEVYFLTGTDEHGTKIARTAASAGKDPQAFTEEIATSFRELKEALNLSWDDFIRTTDTVRHYPGVRQLWETLVASGDIYMKTYRGLYCVGHEAFVTEKELVDGKCPDHQKEPEHIEEENYFFRLSAYGDRIAAAIRSGKFQVVPLARANEILSLIEGEGLQDVSFSRPRASLSWGIPVPNDPAQTIYVWADALTNYISAIGYGRDDVSLRQWWPADAQVIGKDILRFHAAIWPAMLIAAGLELPKRLLVHGFVTVEGKKMSKTVGNVLDPRDLVARHGTDAVRYYFLRDIPSHDDGDFSQARFEERYTADLANGIGNFAARVCALTSAHGAFDASQTVPSDVEARIAKARDEVRAGFELFRLHDALGSVLDLVGFGDAYVNETKPWETKDSAVLYALVVILDNVASLLAPFLPQTAEKITGAIRWEGSQLRVNKIEPLFPRLGK